MPGMGAHLPRCNEIRRPKDVHKPTPDDGGGSTSVQQRLVSEKGKGRQGWSSAQAAQEVTAHCQEQARGLTVSKVVAIDEHMPMIEKANEKVDRLEEGEGQFRSVRSQRPGRA